MRPIVQGAARAETPSDRAVPHVTLCFGIVRAVPEHRSVVLGLAVEKIAQFLLIALAATWLLREIAPGLAREAGLFPARVGRALKAATRRGQCESLIASLTLQRLKPSVSNAEVRDIGRPTDQPGDAKRSCGMSC